MKWIVGVTGRYFTLRWSPVCLSRTFKVDEFKTKVTFDPQTLFTTLDVCKPSQIAIRWR